MLDENIEIINPDDKDYYDNKLFKVGIWPGAGYQLATFKVYANYEEEALNLVVANAEINAPGLLMSIQEIEDLIAENYQEEYNEFISENPESDDFTFATEYLNYIYVDATMEGASQPYFVIGDNLVIEQITDEKKESNNAKVPEGINVSKYGKRTEAVTTNETQVANWLKETVDWLIENEAGCGTWKLDDRLAICVGWSAGYDENDISDNYIHSKDDPTYCINAAIKVWTSDDMRTDLDWINFPYDDENTYDDSYTISKNENYYELAKSLLQVYSTYEGYDIDKDGKIISGPVEESKVIKEDNSNMPHYIAKCTLQENKTVKKEARINNYDYIIYRPRLTKSPVYVKDYSTETENKNEAITFPTKSEAEEYRDNLELSYKEQYKIGVKNLDENKEIKKEVTTKRFDGGYASIVSENITEQEFWDYVQDIESSFEADTYVSNPTNVPWYDDMYRIEIYSDDNSEPHKFLFFTKIFDDETNEPLYTIYDDINVKEENKETKMEARLTDYLGIMQIRDLLQQNKETADKEFAIIDNMEIEVGTGDNLVIYKATKNADNEWELTKVNNKNENLTESINEDGFPNSEELQDYFTKQNTLPDEIEIEDTKYTMTEYGGTGDKAWVIYTDNNNDDSYIRVYYSMNKVDTDKYQGVKNILGVSDLRETKELKKEYYIKPDDEHIIWDSEFDLSDYDKEELKEGPYQDYLEDFDDTVVPMSYEEWLDSNECANYFDFEWEEAAKENDYFSEWYEFITEYVPDDEKETAYNEYVANCENTKLTPDTFEEWLDNNINQLADDNWELQEEDLEQNILPVIDSQINYDTLILAGYYGSNYPDFRSSGNGGKMFDSVEDFRNYMGNFDRVCITTKNGILGSILNDHDGTVSGQFFTLPENLTELVKAINYEQYVDIPEDITDEDEIFEIVMDQFEEDLVYGGVDTSDLTNHIELLVPIKDTISGYTPDPEPKKENKENKEKDDPNKYCIICGKEKEDYEASMCDDCWEKEQARLNLKKTETKLKEVEAVEYISKKDYDEMPEDYKTTIGKTLQARQAVGDNIEKLRQLYKDLGYNEDDPMIMANEKGGTILKPVKVQESKMSEIDIDVKNTLKQFDDYLENEGYDEVDDDVVNEFFTEIFYNIDTEEELEAMNIAEKKIRHKYGLKENKISNKKKIVAKKQRLEMKKENKSNIETVYVPEKDMTIIFEETTDDNDNPTSTEIKGFYYGSPSDDETKKFTGKLKATYDTVQESKTLVEDDTDPEEVANEIQTARENSENDTLSIEQIASSLDVLLVDEQGAIDGYKSYLEQAKQVVSEELYNSIDTQIQEIIKDEEDHIVKLNTMKDTLLGNTDNIPATDIENVDDEENLVVEENKQVTEASSNTIKEELNTGTLPVVNVDMYSLSDNLYEYDIDQKELDDIVLEIAPKYIEDTLSEILPNVSVIAKSVYHPKQYNYSGDELEFDLVVDSNAYEELKEKTLNNPEFKQFLKDNYSSRSGFVSFMADDLDDFKTQEEWKQMVQVIMFNIPEDKIELNNDQYITEFMDNVYMNYAPIDDEDDLTENKSLKTENKDEWVKNWEELNSMIEYYAEQEGFTLNDNDLYDITNNLAEKGVLDTFADFKSNEDKAKNTIIAAIEQFPNKVEESTEDLDDDDDDFPYDNTTEKKCPKCGKTYTDFPALSRKDNKTYICPQCGGKEAMEDYLKSLKEDNSVDTEEFKVGDVVTDLIDNDLAVIEEIDDTRKSKYLLRFVQNPVMGEAFWYEPGRFEKVTDEETIKEALDIYNRNMKK